MNPRSPYQVLDDVACDFGPKRIHLAPSIMAAALQEKTAPRRYDLRRLAFSLILLLLIAVLIAAAPAAVQAMKRLLGFIPGVGFIDESTPLRILAEPVSLTRDGITVAVEQVVLDSEHSVVTYKVEDLPYYDFSPDDYKNNACGNSPVLRLPDGRQLEGKGVADFWATGYRRQYTFPAIPADINEAVFYMPCLLQTRVDAVPEDWEIPLQFIVAQPDVDLTVYPVVDLPTPTPLRLSPTPSMTPEEGSTPPVNDVHLSIDQYVQLDDGYILYGELRWDRSQSSVEMVESTDVHLWDAGGQEIVLQEYRDPGDTAPYGSGVYSLGYKTTGIYTPGPALFQVDSVIINQAVDATFEFDMGPDPQPGQTWQIDLTVDVAGYTLRLSSVELNDAGDSLMFYMDPDSEIINAVLLDAGHELTGGGGGPGVAGFTYRNGLPAGPITVSVVTISVELEGPWQTTVELPLTSLEVSATPPVQVCVSERDWQNALSAGSPLPAGLNGTVALSNLSPQDYLYRAMAAGLDGEWQQVYGMGEAPSLSPDSSRLVYDGPDGLYVVGLGGGESTLLPGTARRDIDPLWSPDGSRIAFTRGPASGLIGVPGAYDIMVCAADGSQMQQLTGGVEASQAQTWMPDGEHLLYTVEQEQGSRVYLLDVRSGESDFLFETNYRHSSVTVSPDGRRVAFVEMLPGERYGIYLAELDGSDKRLLVDAYPLVITRPLWSPDGRRLAAAVHDYESESQTPQPLLLNPDTCELYPLYGLDGYITSWRASAGN